MLHIPPLSKQNHHVYMLILALVLLGVLFVVKQFSPTPDSTLSGSGTQNIQQVSKELPPITFGSGNHEFTIFTDYQCPACINFHASIGKVLEEYAGSGKIKLTYKNYPLVQIHKNAMRDAEAVLSAHAQNRYLEYAEAMYNFEYEKKGASVSDDERIKLFEEVLVKTGDTNFTGSLDTFKEALKSGYYKTIIDKDVADGDGMRIEGTPTVFLDGKIWNLNGIRSEEDLRRILDGIGKK